MAIDKQIRFYHCVDLGVFIFVKDNGDETGVFRKVKDVYEHTSLVRDSEFVTYTYSEMVEIY